MEKIAKDGNVFYVWIVIGVIIGKTALENIEDNLVGLSNGLKRVIVPENYPGFTGLVSQRLGGLSNIGWNDRPRQR